MFASLLPCPPECMPAYFAREQVPERRASNADRRPRWPVPGTGGFASRDFWAEKGNARIVIEKAPDRTFETVERLAKVKQSFGRTFSSLPTVFGVSRQTLYNWQESGVQRAEHRAKLQQLSAAAHVFDREQFKPNATMLELTLTDGKSFLQLLAENQSGKEVAEKLVRVERRAAVKRADLERILGSRPVADSSADTGAPATNEDA